MKTKFFRGWRDYLAIILLVSILVFVISIFSSTFFNEIPDVLGYIFVVSYVILIPCGIVFWLVMIADCEQRGKWIWFVVMIFTGFLTSLIYYFEIYRKITERKDYRKNKI